MINEKIKLEFELSSRSKEFKESLVNHVGRRWPFILYNDKENYAKYHPSNFMVQFCQDGVITEQVCADENKYQLSIALSATFYEKIHSLSPVIEYKSDYKQLSDQIKTIEE